MEKIKVTPKKRAKFLYRVFENTGTFPILTSFIIFIFVDAALIWIFEPTIHTYGDAIWYCYAVISTAGFGDVVVTTFIPKVLSILLTMVSVMTLAVLTGVVVNQYSKMVELRNKETLAAFFDQLERLPELDEKELRDLSEKVKKFRKNWGRK
jgi:voltage-gated potassium channel